MAEIRYPVGVQSFEQIINDGYLYVDKTEIIYRLVTTGKIYFLSRPRRFGKSLLVSTLECYFRGRKDLFKGLAIDTLEKDWTEYPVFHMDFNSGNFTNPGELEKKINGHLSDWELVYGVPGYELGLGDRFTRILKKAHDKTGRRCVVLIDEYDKPLLDVIETGIKTNIAGNEMLLEDWHRNVLKGFYSVFKEADNDIQFVLLTGVTKFSQVSVFSGFNQPKDISMDARYEALCGITQQELDTQFTEPLKALAESQGTDVETVKERLKAKYDGYHFSTKMTDIYNPFSLLSAFDAQTLNDYWFSSGTPGYLMRLLAKTKENLSDLTGKYYPASSFIDFKADREMPLPMIYQSGYLTVKDYNLRRNTYLLDFPNEEVAGGFLSLASAGYFKKDEGDVTCWMQDLGDALEAGDTRTARDLLASFLADVPYDLRDNDDAKLRERHFQYTLYLIFRFLGTYVVSAEKHSSQGRADCIVQTPRYIYVFEFKLDGSACEALAQIDEKGYATPFAADPRKLVKIGVNFSSRTGTIEGWAEG